MHEIDTCSPSIPRLYISHPFTGDKLDHINRNWNDWRRQILITLTINGLKRYVQGTTMCPSDSEPHAQSNWRKNDKLAFNFILLNIDTQEQEFVDNAAVTTAKDCWDALEKRHMNLGPVPLRQLQLIREGISTRFSHHTESLHASAAKVCALAKRTVAMGELTVDALACIFILSGLDSYPHLQTIINHNASRSTKEKPYTYTDIIRLLKNEHWLLEADKTRHVSTSTALAARTVKKTTCANCKKTGHSVGFCISSGGGMAGKTIEESKKARREARDSKRNRGTPASGSKGKIPMWARDADGRAFLVYLDSA
ncbi:hypothetical protein M378DRAFT_160545 [Amanita muscaria Koide BX008]|uniref:Uncharacterized protein n=1 Tax=Amanita muscaria (strain Koide BX008) TaxID=946122 RepID=A0A0C2WXN4_AMAMK|nr:hypothetical protein M378DRAFT_160545 [Amanita muscaria Koide BX008]